MDFKNIIESEKCPCGKEHKVPIDQIIVEKGAIKNCRNASIVTERRHLCWQI